MMNCEEALILISGHIDGQNTAEEEASLRAHLETCASCCDMLRAYEELDSGIAALEAEPPRELIPRVMERITEQPTEQKHKRRFFFGGGTAIAAVAAVLLLLISTGKLPDFQKSKTATARTTQSDAADEESAPKAAAEIPMSDSALDTPYSAEENGAANTPSDAAESPMLMTAEAPQPDTLTLEVTDNPQAPAETAIAALSALTAEPTGEDGVVQYRTDAATLRIIIKTYGDAYSMTVPEGLDSAEDDTICIIRIVEP